MPTYGSGLYSESVYGGDNIEAKFLVHNGTEWVERDDISLYRNGTFEEIVLGQVYDGSVWRAFKATDFQHKNESDENEEWKGHSSTTSSVGGVY